MNSNGDVLEIPKVDGNHVQVVADFCLAVCWETKEEWEAKEELKEKNSDEEKQGRKGY